MALTAPADRGEAVVRQKWLTAATIGWNSVEGVVAIVAGVAAGSVSLIGFGLDSGIEVSAALILTWRLAQERRTGCKQDVDKSHVQDIMICSSYHSVIYLTSCHWVSSSHQIRTMRIS